MKKILMAAMVAAACMASCSGPSGWSVKGTIEGADKGTKIALEGFNNGRWYVVDSLEIGRGGSFAYKAEAPAQYSEIMRLSMPGVQGNIYFPVAASDAVSVEASADAFGSGYKLGGTAMAQAVGRVDSIVASGAALDDVRRGLVREITADTTGLVAYYAVGKSLNGVAIFDPADNVGNRVYGAAAQVYAQYQPEDPRGIALKKAFFDGRRLLGKAPEMPAETVYEVPETGLIDIVRYDAKGRRHSLAELASQGKVVLLNFTGYGLETSPAYNAMLNDLYTLYHDRGLEIFQIAFDEDEVTWKEAAANLPWITVWNAPTDGISVLASYNVGALPLTYVIDRKGDLAERVTDPSKLGAKVAAQF